MVLSYTRVPRPGDQQSHDLYGFMAGYEGGGCYSDEFFHVGERRGDGFVSYTPSFDCGWADDSIGFSGLAGTGFADGVERLLESIQHYVFRRWLRWTDDGLPDLQNSAKRRLNCERRRAFYLSRGFDEELLAFMSPKWPISLRFGPQADAFRRHHQEVLARIRAKQGGVETAITKYPELLGSDVRFVERQLVGRRAVLLFRDESDAKLIVEPKWGPPSETEISNLARYKVTISRHSLAPIRVVLFSTSVSPDQERSLSQFGIAYRGISRVQLIQFLHEKHDERLAALFERQPRRPCSPQ